jgi:hypothetical protein
MRSYTITEEPIPQAVPVMFQRLQKEAQEPVETGPDVIVYIENRKRVFVRDRPHLIQGIADLLTLQGIPYRTYKNDQIQNIENLFSGLESGPGWYDWCCSRCGMHGRTTIKDFECHPGLTQVIPSQQETI